MRTYDRNGVHIEQCEMCRGIFLDYGELEALTRMQQQYMQAPPPPAAPAAPAAPAWGASPQVHHHHHGQPHHYRQKSVFHMLFST
ncbi:Zn-finger nucleic acid-binding protein [Actinomadura cellulosilytica]|uniref:Zn-finger nucleic acid-binding protein n=2 Tax=Thermomonosporaceae TaxID=2012 RepID=A0A7W3MZ56_9ACTN|nr:Zn-finger nucleic acid-binding protein [Thermomonospora cellulosilytica]